MATVQLKSQGAADALTQTYHTETRAFYDTCDGFLGSLLLLDASKATARSITGMRSSYRASRRYSAADPRRRFKNFMTQGTTECAELPGREERGSRGSRIGESRSRIRPEERIRISYLGLG